MEATNEERDTLARLMLWFAAVLLGFFLICFFLRNPVLRFTVNRQIREYNSSGYSSLVIRSLRFEGLWSVRIAGLSIGEKGGDTLLKAGTLMFTINPWKLFAGRISITSLRMEDIYLTVVRRDSLTNYNFLLQKNKNRETVIEGHSADSSRPVSASIDYSASARSIFRWIFDKVPSSTEIRNLNIKSLTDGHEVLAQIDSLSLSNHEFSTLLRITENNQTSLWKTSGMLDNDSRSSDLLITSAGKDKVRMPYIGYKWKAFLAFDSLRMSFSAGSYGSDNAGIKGSLTASAFEIYHERIAMDTVRVASLNNEFQINFHEDAVELDSSSVIGFNRLAVHPYLRYRPSPSRQLTVRINTPYFPAQDLFSSLPEGLFENLRGLRTSGELAFHLDFFADFSHLEELIFNMDLERRQFRVLSYGDGRLLKLDSSFSYTAFEKGQPVRTFEVGPSNHDFRKLSQISPFLRFAVMTSEDGGFYLHRGFIADAFRESLIENLRQGRFVRGGSTISMQLVKNVYLSRNKTISRKMEEALIVWLIENQQLCSKDRMFEVYLNIIEWGPMIYGATEASRFYFSKEPSQLSLEEAIFMASVIPRPKWFAYSFTEEGTLQPYMAEFYQLVSGKMLKKGWITQDEHDKLKPEVNLRGPARLMLKNPVDTLIEQ